MTTTRTDFGRLLAAAHVLGAGNDVAGAKKLLETARELSATAICQKCAHRREREATALSDALAGLREGAAPAANDRAAAR